MHIDNDNDAALLLSRLNYYRLSGYWHPMRQFDPNTGLIPFSRTGTPEDWQSLSLWTI